MIFSFQEQNFLLATAARQYGMPFEDYQRLIKCEECGAANMTIYMTGADRKRRCRKCHNEYISPNPPKKERVVKAKK